MIGLGELTFLQLSTTYAPPSIAGHSVGYVLQTSVDAELILMVRQVFCLGNWGCRARRCINLVGSSESWRPSGSWPVLCLSFNSCPLEISPLILPSFQVMPFIIPLTYFYLLPHNSTFISLGPDEYEEETSLDGATALPYTPLPSAEDEDGEEEGSLPPGPRKGVSLSSSDKWRLVKPLLVKYMLPLCKSRYQNIRENSA